MSAQPLKFNFDLDLGRQDEKTSVLTDTALAKKLEEARQAGYDAGFVEGENSTAAQAARQLALAAQDLSAHVASMAATLDDQRKIDLAEAVELAGAVGRKLAATLIDQHPETEIAALVAQCLATIDNAPHLVIRCAPDLADAVRDGATEHMTTSGFTGRLVVLGDPDIAPGDARIEWADGGVARDHEHLMAQIDTTIAAYFAAHDIAPATRPALSDILPEASAAADPGSAQPTIEADPGDLAAPDATEAPTAADSDTAAPDPNLPEEPSA